MKHQAWLSGVTARTCALVLGILLADGLTLAPAAAQTMPGAKGPADARELRSGQPQPAAETELVLGPQPGQIIFDASNGKHVFPVPAGVRSFGTRQDFFDFMARELNALRVTDANNSTLGVQGRLLTLGRPLTVDGQHNIVPITDPILAFLGGKAGSAVANRDSIACRYRIPTSAAAFSAYCQMDTES